MAEFKIVINDPKTGKSFQRAVKDDEAKEILNQKIGAKIKGDSFGLTGYEFLITGGSDYCGFPMRQDVSGQARKKIYTVEGVGVVRKDVGIRQRKTVAGDTIYTKTAQVNLKILSYGKAALEEPKAEEKKE